MELPTGPDTKPKHLFNPLLEDFTITHLDDENNPHTYTIHGMEVETYPTHLADHIKKHLITHIMNKRGYEPNVERQKEAISKEVEAVIEEEDE